jgi:peptidoglycan/LPS O-acetylase OafA/YrhL
MNESAGLMGMALFFVLSGFLIVRFLAEGMKVGDFAIRRLARVVPLAWLAIIALWLVNPSASLWPNLLFYSNLPPIRLLPGGLHLWSLSVEVQFYALAAVLCLLPSRRSLFFIPALCLSVTAFRIYSETHYSVVTWHRVDEILAGGTVALIFSGWFGPRPSAILGRIPLWASALALFACSYPPFGAMLYLRPYAGALVLTSAIYALDDVAERLLVNRPMAYIAEVSYALYIFHGMLTSTWLGSGVAWEKYVKRPVLFGVTFGLAHISTFYFEKPVTKWARLWSAKARIGTSKLEQP